MAKRPSKPTKAQLAAAEQATKQAELDKAASDRYKKVLFDVIDSYKKLGLPENQIQMAVLVTFNDHMVANFNYIHQVLGLLAQKQGVDLSVLNTQQSAN